MFKGLRDLFVFWSVFVTRFFSLISKYVAGHSRAGLIQKATTCASAGPVHVFDPNLPGCDVVLSEASVCIWQPT